MPYKKVWETDFAWVKAGPTTEEAECKWCKTILSISKGKGQLTQHEKYGKHVKQANVMKNQSSLTTSLGLFTARNTVNNEKDQQFAKFEDRVAKAEIIRILDIVDNNGTFSATDADAQKYQRMFPDSAIANGYKQAKTKTTYALTFGLAPLLRKEITNEITGPFTLKFDETTTIQTKKQFDAYATYMHGVGDSISIKTSYLGSQFLGGCNAEALVDHIQSAIGELNPQLMISVGMDGPNVNKSAIKKMNDKLASRMLISVGTCSLHTVSNAFLVGTEAMCNVYDLNQLCSDLHAHFKYSAKRTEDYLNSEDMFTDPQKMIRHATTRWVSIVKVLVRILEQFDNLKVYFLEKLPQQEDFNRSKGLGKSERYMRIKKALTDKKVPAILAAVVYIGNIFQNFIVPLQTKSPMIPVLWSKFKTLISSSLGCFISDSVCKKDGSLRTFTKLAKIKLDNGSSQKVSVPNFLFYFK